MKTRCTGRCSKCRHFDPVAAQSMQNLAPKDQVIVPAGCGLPKVDHPRFLKIHTVGANFAVAKGPGKIDVLLPCYSFPQLILKPRRFA
jgi:hypothetical protein